jgi:hypothetical protein
MLLEGLLAITQGGTDRGNIVAAISGRNDDDVGMVVHRNGTNDTNPDALQRGIDFLRGAIARRPNFLLSKDGKLFGSGVDLTGHINADSGRIGAFEIDGRGVLAGRFDGNAVFLHPRQIPPLNTLTGDPVTPFFNVTSHQTGATAQVEEYGVSPELRYNDGDTERIVTGHAVQGGRAGWLQVHTFTVPNNGLRYRFDSAVLNVLSNTVHPQGMGVLRIETRIQQHRIVNTANNSIIAVTLGTEMNIPAGTYRFDSSIEYGWNYPGGLSFPAGASTTINVRITASTIGHPIGRDTAHYAFDGFSVVRNSVNYFYYSATEGLHVVRNNGGFRVLSNGVTQVSRNGTWVNL